MTAMQSASDQTSGKEDFFGAVFDHSLNGQGIVIFPTNWLPMSL